MAPTTLSQASTSGRNQQPAMPETLQQNIKVPMDTDEDEGEITPAHPSTHEGEVKKLKKKLRDLGAQHNNLLKSAKKNSRIAQDKIRKLEEQVKLLLDCTNAINKDAEKSRKLYREHIEHISSLAVTGKDSREILKPRQLDLYNRDPEKLQEFLTSLRSYHLYYPIQFTTDELKGSAAAYLAEYHYQASRLNWNEEAHMAQVYLGLKEEVKDALVNIRPKPKNLNELTAIVVEIDDQQYERRREKQAMKTGGSHNPK
ncbi:hypothetical protein ACKAV7_014105 [Fusarium commune]